MNKFDRIYCLHHIFSHRRYPIDMSSLCREMECSEATVKRIIGILRDVYHAPIFNVRGKGWRYDPSKHFELPGLWFNADELAALLGIQQLLTGMQQGLLDELLQPLRKRVDALLARAAPGAAREIGRIRILGMMPRAKKLPRFDAVAGAVLTRKRLRIRYAARSSGETTTREVSPQRLVHYRDNWYLDAYCHLREGLRSFAVERIDKAGKLAKAAVEIGADALDAHYASAYGIFAGQADKQAVLRFSAHAARWVADETWHPRQSSCWLDDGHYELSIPYGDATELMLDICRYGPDVVVVAPASLRHAVAERLRQAAARYD